LLRKRNMCWTTGTIEGRVAVLLSAFALAVPYVAGAQSEQAPRFVVVLDAAHGGDDVGGRLANGQTEKAVTLALSVKLRSVLNARGIAVVTTRESDAAMDTDRRAGIANHAKAAACLSLHATETGAGLHLFTSSLAPATATRFTAWKTAQAGSVTRSLALAGSLNSALLAAGMKVTLGRTTLAGVDSMTCPAVAIELAPERGADGAVTAEPTDPDYQARVAATLASALLAWRSDAQKTAPQQTGAAQP
jgi:N-acetylmuramoyl-L-alanine amidase